LEGNPTCNISRENKERVITPHPLTMNIRLVARFWNGFLTKKDLNIKRKVRVVGRNVVGLG